MKISYKCDYALKVMLELALRLNKGVITSQELSKKLDIPLKFLEQVLADLRKGGFIESKRGNQGGYLLIGNPAKIYVGQIIRHIDGPIEPIDCIDPSYKNCRDMRQCVYRKLWCKVSKAIADIIDNTSLEDLVKEVLSTEEYINYSI